MTTAGNTATDKLHGLKDGDRVRVTFEADVIDGGDTIRFAPDSLASGRWYLGEISKSPTFRIERIEKPLAVGDRVRFRGHDYEVVADPRVFSGSYIEAPLWSDDSGFISADITDLARIP